MSPWWGWNDCLWSSTWSTHDCRSLFRRSAVARCHGSSFRCRSLAVSPDKRVTKSALTSRIPFKQLTVDRLAEAIADALSPGRKQYAAELGTKISSEVSTLDSRLLLLSDLTDWRDRGCGRFSFTLASREHAVSSQS